MDGKRNGAVKKQQKKEKNCKKKMEVPIKVSNKNKSTFNTEHHNIQYKNSSKMNQDDSDDVLANSAFVNSAVKNKIKSKNIETENSSKKNLRSLKMNRVDDRTAIIDNLQGFTTVTRDKKVNKLISENPSEAIGKKAYELILQGEKIISIQCLSRAIAADPSDIRHYINRSYCFLNDEQYSSSIKDIRHVLRFIDDPVQISLMKCREGQALWGQKNYESAMKCFEEGLNFLPNCAPIKCEIMRMKFEALITLGFPTKRILELFQGVPDITIKDAVTFLSEFEWEDESESSDSDSSVEDEIFQSDSEDCLSNTRIFMDIIDFDRKNQDVSWYKCWTRNTNNINAQTMVDGMQVLNTTASSKLSTKKVQKKAVWIGNLTSNITENILLQHFSKFGKVQSVVKQSERYAFINFEEANVTQKVLEIGTINIGGKQLLLKSAVR